MHHITTGIAMTCLGGRWPHANSKNLRMACWVQRNIFFTLNLYVQSPKVNMCTFKTFYDHFVSSLLLSNDSLNINSSNYQSAGKTEQKFCMGNCHIQFVKISSKRLVITRHELYENCRIYHPGWCFVSNP
jgi:hypothetical protein